MAETRESVMPFRGGETWYRLTIPTTATESALPLIVLHGGPGMAHNYVANIAELADETGRTVVHYDQFGCGRSSHRPDEPASFWSPALFVEEFTTLVGHLGLADYHVLGQSWGGMLGAEIAVGRPEGLVSLSICNSPADMQSWVEAAAKLRSWLPADMREALARHEAAGTLDHPDYLAATAEFYRRHVCRMTPLPEDFRASEAQVAEDPTVYHTMNGPNEFHVVGSMRTWSIVDRLHRINVPTMVLAGEFDEATPHTWHPYVENIRDVRSYVFPNASHCTHLEHPEQFRSVIADFLAAHEVANAPAS